MVPRLATMTLTEWLEANPDLEDELVQYLGCHPKSIYKYATGARIPIKPTMQRIYAFCEGLVDANGFYGLSDIKPIRHKKREAAAKRTA